MYVYVCTTLTPYPETFPSTPYNPPPQHAHTHTQTHTHAYAHTHTHTHNDTHTHTRTHPRTRIAPGEGILGLRRLKVGANWNVWMFTRGQTCSYYYSSKQTKIFSTELNNYFRVYFKLSCSKNKNSMIIDRNQLKFIFENLL